MSGKGQSGGAPVAYDAAAGSAVGSAAAAAAEIAAAQAAVPALPVASGGLNFGQAACNGDVGELFSLDKAIKRDRKLLHQLYKVEYRHRVDIGVKVGEQASIRGQVLEVVGGIERGKFEAARDAWQSGDAGRIKHANKALVKARLVRHSAERAMTEFVKSNEISVMDAFLVGVGYGLNQNSMRKRMEMVEAFIANPRYVQASARDAHGNTIGHRLSYYCDNAAKGILTLERRKSEHEGEIAQIRAHASGRDLTPDENTKIANLEVEIAVCDVSIHQAQDVVAFFHRCQQALLARFSHLTAFITYASLRNDKGETPYGNRHGDYREKQAMRLYTCEASGEVLVKITGPDDVVTFLQHLVGDSISKYPALRDNKVVHAMYKALHCQKTVTDKIADIYRILQSTRRFFERAATLDALNLSAKSALLKIVKYTLSQYFIHFPDARQQLGYLPCERVVGVLPGASIAERLDQRGRATIYREKLREPVLLVLPQPLMRRKMGVAFDLANRDEQEVDVSALASPAVARELGSKRRGGRAGLMPPAESDSAAAAAAALAAATTAAAEAPGAVAANGLPYRPGSGGLGGGGAD
jgi:hypothetical protein